MGIFDRIKGAIFGSASASPTAASAPATTSPIGATSAADDNRQADAAGGGGGSAPAPAKAASTVDVSEILDNAVAKKGQKLDWRHSIVDLMKALDLDSSLAARRELAGELDYTGDTSDTATMNMWLHKALMKKLAENGGKVPSDLTS